ncbi:polysaccharide biosynthesis/export family protein [Polymorphum gilvum]|uniref:Exopolysaccharide export protein n=1 Tax=Polymorphum gilvum (strain LMG 25793 / CGMCC 1.9160 / SL003B-26A1) TaxID=991905 RepID=F2IW60_POLGS|nr:polysaccharide biosynthesis/export family protein [Polymorphum gilvum]ADZ71445.1 Exopolysaccharide export protein [Polymorphum gilvum SL003B-26A1]
MDIPFFRILLMCSTAMVAGCETLPRSGPDHGAIQAQATDSIVEKTGDAQRSAMAYAFLDLTPHVLSYVKDPGIGSLNRSFGGGRGGAPEILVGVGDVIQVTIFESAAGGLFIPADAGSRPGNFVNLPQQTVDKRGYISVPYAGQILAAGRSLPQIQTEIEAKLANRAIEPQAVVAFIERNATSAAVVGEVNAPNKLDINESGDRILDLISRAGGLKYPGYESFITLQRGGRSAKVYFNAIIANPQENIYVAPGDTLYVDREQRSFQAFGASGLSGEFKFDQEELTLAQGVGKAGGLLDSRADPGQVFVYRLESRTALEEMGIDSTRFDPSAKQIPTIYRTNFRDPSGYFLAQKFKLRSEDIVYISNADSVELVKFLTVLNSVTSTVSGVSGDARFTRNHAVSLSKGFNVTLDE